MEPMTNYHVDDPYPVPFHSPLPLEAPEEVLYGIVPCSLGCETGWLPLDDGGYIACPECQPEYERGV
jgi:hypothetical protein